MAQALHKKGSQVGVMFAYKCDFLSTSMVYTHTHTLPWIYAEDMAFLKKLQQTWPDVGETLIFVLFRISIN